MLAGPVYSGERFRALGPSCLSCILMPKRSAKINITFYKTLHAYLYLSCLISETVHAKSLAEKAVY